VLLEPRRRDDDAPGMRGAVSRSAPATLCANTGHILMVVGEPEDHVVGYPARGGVRRPKAVRLGTPERPVRTWRSGDKVSRYRRALDAGGSVQPLRHTCYGYGAQQGAPDQPRRALTLPSDPALAPRHAGTLDLHCDALVSTSWAPPHCTMTAVIVYECVVA
jgi:hypothetical protein